ncbi:uncharacterized protein METZ01_LOCUS195101, partial [marine metagenome]
MKTKKLLFIFLSVLSFFFLYPTVSPAQQIPTPEAFFGFRMGTDRKLARWDKMVDYYHMLEEMSQRIKVENMGTTTLDNPFLALYISSPDNLARLEEIRQHNATLSDPRGVAQA